MNKFITILLATTLFSGIAYAEQPPGLVGESTNVTGSGTSRTQAGDTGYNIDGSAGVDKRTGIDKRRLKALKGEEEVTESKARKSTLSNKARIDLRDNTVEPEEVK